MDDQEKIKSFGDMVDATERLTRPWKRALWAALAVIVITNLVWGFVVYSMARKPVAFYQSQNFPEQLQSQQYTYGTDGSAARGEGD